MTIEAGKRLPHATSSIHIHTVVDPDNNGPAPRLIQFYELDELPPPGPACPVCGRETVVLGVDEEGVPVEVPAYEPDARGWPVCKYGDYDSGPMARAANGEAAKVIKRSMLVPQAVTDEDVATAIVRYAGSERAETARIGLDRIRVNGTTELVPRTRTLVRELKPNGDLDASELITFGKRTVSLDGEAEEVMLVVLPPGASRAEAQAAITSARRQTARVAPEPIIAESAP